MKFAKNPKKTTACIASLSLGAIGTFAYSPFDIWLLAFVSASGLVWAATLDHRPTAHWATLAWSLGYFCTGVSWVSVSMTQFGGVPTVVSYLAVLLLAGYLAFYNLLFGFISHKFALQRSPFALAAVFTFTEYLRGVVFTGFPWLQFGYSLIDSPFAGLAPIFGVEGLTFLVVAAAGYIVKLLNKEIKLMPFALLQAVIFSIAFASRFIDFVEIDESKAPLTVSLVQGNIEQKMKWDPQHFNHSVQTYEQLLVPLLGKSEVIILPESALPALENNIEPILTNLDDAARRSGSEVIIGTLYQNGEGELFNSAVLLGGAAQPYSIDSSDNRYNKHHLVPFGEYVPLGAMLDWMREVFILPINLSQGRFVQPSLSAKNRRFNMAICYEIIFGNQVQQNQLNQNADYLLTITNDAWFGSSIGPWQHFQMARMRALELGKPLLRTANTGITAIVDAHGKVIARLPQFTTEVLTASVRTTQGETPFTRFGGWLIYALSGLYLAAITLPKAAKKRS